MRQKPVSIVEERILLQLRIIRPKLCKSDRKRRLLRVWSSEKIHKTFLQIFKLKMHGLVFTVIDGLKH